jgi:hypothetical protein
MDPICAFPTDKYRKRRAPSSSSSATFSSTNQNKIMPTQHDTLIGGCNPQRHSTVPNNNNAKYGDNPDQLQLITAAYLTEHHRVNEELRKSKLQNFVRTYGHLLPIQDSGASIEGRAFALFLLLGFD